MSVARFIADQRTNYRVPHTFVCAPFGVSLAWFCKWVSRTPTPTPTEQRRAKVDAAVADAFRAARGLHGSPRLIHDLRDDGWTISGKTVVDSMPRSQAELRRNLSDSRVIRRGSPNLPDQPGEPLSMQLRC